MRVVQLMASPFHGGPERQMLGLTLALPRQYHSTFLTFSEGGRCRSLLQEVRRHGIEAIELRHNFPHVHRAAREIAVHLRRLRADVVCCSGYKPDLIGWLAARQAGVPVVSVSHGWTGASWRVRLYEMADRLALSHMDAIVCVSEAQAIKVRRTRAPAQRIHVIRNAVALGPFGAPQERYRQEMQSFFPSPPRQLVGAAGRLSPEKGFEKLIEAAALVVAEAPGTGFVIFGEGPCRTALMRQIAARGLQQHVVLPGFRDNLEKYLPHFDLVALSSYTEGLPVIVLEALAAGVPVVGTTVGGVPEVIENGITGVLVPPGNAEALARSMLEMLRDHERCLALGQRGRQVVEERFTFAAQAAQYQQLFQHLEENPRRLARRA